MLDVVFENGFINFLRHGARSFAWRLRAQGSRLTILWLYGQGISVITGTPMLKFCKITPQILVGPQYSRAGKAKLSHLGINGTVNMRIEFDDAAHNLDLAHYCYLPTIDGTPPTLEQLNDGVAFIKRITEEGGKVYIHCHGGMGRAPTMAAAYFISQGESVDDALEKIMRVRPFINVRPNQLNQLHAFESIQAES